MQDKNTSVTEETQARGYEERMALFEQNIGLVRSVAINISLRLKHNPVLDIDDYFTTGLRGLWKAAEKYESIRGAAFSTYATTRIRGEILDEVRNVDSHTRTDRDKLSAIAKASSKFFLKNKRQPSQGELAEILGISLRDLKGNQALAFHCVSLDEPQNGEEGYLLGEEIADQNHRHPSVGLMDSEDYSTLLKVVDSLADREKTVLRQYFWENKTLEEVGEYFGVSGEAIRQGLQKTLNKMKRRISGI